MSTLITPPINGTVVLTPDGGFTYTPNNAEGLDLFSYSSNREGERPKVIHVRIDVREQLSEPRTGTGSASEVYQARAQAAKQSK